MITIIVPEWFVWLMFSMFCISIVLQVVGLILKAARLQIARNTKDISDEIIEKYGQLDQLKNQL